MTQTEEQQKKDEYYMRRALDEARQAYDAGEIPVGAVVVCKDRIIARGHNLTETLTDVTHRGTLRDVCRCHRMGTDQAYRLWLRG